MMINRKKTDVLFLILLLCVFVLWYLSVESLGLRNEYLKNKKQDAIENRIIYNGATDNNISDYCDICGFRVKDTEGDKE